MAADVIPLVRIKLLPGGPLPARLQPIEKAPPKTHDMRLTLPPSRVRGLQCDGVAPLTAFKPAHRITRRAPKMRLFRSFKLFTAMKDRSTGALVAGPVAAGPVVAGL